MLAMSGGLLVNPGSHLRHLIKREADVEHKASSLFKSVQQREENKHKELVIIGMERVHNSRSISQFRLMSIFIPCAPDSFLPGFINDAAVSSDATTTI